MLTKLSSCTRNSAFYRVARVAHLAESNEQLKVGKDRKKGSKIKNSFQQQFAYQVPYLMVLYVHNRRFEKIRLQYSLSRTGPSQLNSSSGPVGQPIVIVSRGGDALGSFLARSQLFHP